MEISWQTLSVSSLPNPSDMYICQDGIYFCEGGYARIAVKLFNSLDVDVFYVSENIPTIYDTNREQLEYDTERAGDFTPLKHLPLNKVVVLGLVTTKNKKVSSVWTSGFFF